MSDKPWDGDRNKLIADLEAELEEAIIALINFDSVPLRDVGKSAGQLAVRLNTIQFRLRVLREPA